MIDMLLFVIYILLFVTINCEGNQPCDIGWTGGQGSFSGCCYKFIEQSTVGNNRSKAICKELGGYVSSIHSKEENDFIADTFRKRHGGRFIWIGYVAKTSRSTKFAWVDESSSSFTNWQKGEPNNRGGVTEDCTVMEVDNSKSYKWYDFPCGRHSSLIRGFVCKTCNRVPGRICFDSRNNCFQNGVRGCEGKRAYIGKTSKTKSGRECQKWSSQTPHNPRDGKFEPENYCRNPDGDKGPWCFTTDPKKQHERCFKDCEGGACYDSENNCFQHGATGCKGKRAYIGIRSETRSGTTCDRWSNHVPGSGEQHNYCRNPDNRDGPWCWTSSGPVQPWEYCFRDCQELLSCQGGYVPTTFNNCCYKFASLKGLTHAEADNECQKSGAHLVSIHSNQENDFVADTFRKRHGGQYIWIGYVSKMSRSRNFLWLDSITSQYTNWQYGEPDNRRGNVEDCAMMEVDSTKSSKWHDFVCRSSSIIAGFVCKTCSGVSGSLYHCDNNGDCAKCGGETGVTCNDAKYLTKALCDPACKRSLYHCDNNGNCAKCGGETGVTCNDAKYLTKALCDRVCQPLRYHCVVGECEVCDANTNATCTTPNYDDPSCNSTYQCQDKNASCRFWQSIGECQINLAWMTFNCPDACGICPSNETGNCSDSVAFCPYWQSIGECKANAVWMSLNCQKSCGVCQRNLNETGSWICSGKSGSRHCIECGATTKSPCPSAVKLFSDATECNGTCN